MSKPRYDWWSYCKGMIRRYPHLREMHEETMRQQTTASYSGMPSGGGDGRGLERGVIRALSNCEAKEFDAVDKAILQTMQLQTGELRIALIELVFWSRTHTLDGAAQKIHISYITAKRWHSSFIRQVAKNYGLLD